MKPPDALIDFAAKESLRMERLASEYRQMGFLALASYLSEQSKAAMRYAVGKEPKR